MLLYAAKGDRSAALRQYQICVQLLDEELSVAPEEETTAVYESLRQQTSRPREAARTCQNAPRMATADRSGLNRGERTPEPGI